jgi:hypothetical protein
MAQRTAIYDLQGNFVMYGTHAEAFTFLKDVLGVGYGLKVSHLSVAQITSLNYEQALKLKASYIKEN